MAFAKDLANTTKTLLKSFQKGSSPALKSAESALLAGEFLSPRAVEIRRDKNEYLQELDREEEIKMIKGVLKDAKRANLSFLGGVTLGTYLQENIPEEERTDLSQKIGVSLADLNNILADRMMPKGKVSEELFSLLAKKGLSYTDYILYKGHQFKKIKELQS